MNSNRQVQQPSLSLSLLIPKPQISQETRPESTKTISAMKLNTNTTLTWQTPHRDLVFGIAKIPFIIGATLLIVFASLLIINIVIEEIRDFIRREVKQAFKQQQKQEIDKQQRRQEADRQQWRQEIEQQQKSEDVEIAPWESVSNQVRSLKDVEFGEESDVDFLAAWKRYNKDLKHYGKTSEAREGCFDRFQKDLAARREEAEDKKWRRAIAETEGRLLAEFGGEATEAGREAARARCKKDFELVDYSRTE